MAKLGNFFTIASGGTPDKRNPSYYENGTIPWVKTGDLKNQYVPAGIECITEEGLNNSSAKLFPPNTVLVAMYGATIGACSILTYKAATNQACAAFLPNKNVLPTYLYYFLSSKREQFVKDGVGGAQPNISAGYLKNVQFGLIPMQQQIDIVEKLDKVEKLIVLRKEQLAKLDQLVKSRFIELFGDLKTNPKGWPVLPFPAFAEIDGNMTTDYERYADYPHIGIDSIEKGTGELKGYRTVREDGVISGKYIFTPQHIIYSKIRPNLNKVALPAFEGLCSADAYPILPNRENCNRVFLAVAMRSEYYLEYILQFSSRTNLPKVNRKEIAGFRMPLPPLPLQEQFAAFVEQTDKSKLAIQQSLDKLELLKKSLMQKYFG